MEALVWTYVVLISCLLAPVLGQQIALAEVPDPALAHLQASLAIYVNNEGRAGLFQSPNGMDAAIAERWAEFVKADLDLLAQQTKSLIISARVQSKNREMDTIIARLSQTKSYIAALQKAAARLACKCPVWATFDLDMTTVQRRNSSVEAKLEFACLLQAIFRQFSTALVEARTSQERLQVKQQQALAEIAQLRSKLAAQKEQVEVSRAGRDGSLANLCQQISDKKKSSQVAAFCRARLLSALRKAGKTSGRLPQRLPPPVASPPGEAPQRKESAFGIGLGPELDVELLSPVFSVGDGEVILAEYLSGFGLTAVISHGASEIAVFSHLAAVLVRPGDSVKVGQQIAFSGQSGLTEHSSLLFVLLKNGRFKDPRPRIDWPSRPEESPGRRPSKP